MSTGLWGHRIPNANKYYETWENNYKCATLEEYYRGKQWRNRGGNVSPVANMPYTLNMFYSNIETKLANNLFQRPSFQISPKAGSNSDWEIDFAVQSAQIKQDVLNTVIQNPNLNFTKHLKRCYKDSFFRFGIMEVGFASDWRNPQREQDELASHTNPDVRRDRVVQKKKEIPVNERSYVKRIKPWRFRTSITDAEDLNNQEWFGYYSWFYTNALKKIDSIHWPSIDPNENYLAADVAGYSGSTVTNQVAGNRDLIQQLRKDGAITKVWHIWSMVEKREILLRDEDFAELWSDDFTSHPIIDLRWCEEFEGFYPIPPSYHWISSQNEINQTREQIKAARQRYTRRYQAVKDKVDQPEIDKFVDGGDGTVVTVKEKDAISAIPEGNVSQTTVLDLQQAREDMNIIVGNSAEARGPADRETATQAKITDIRSQVRESAEQLEISNFACAVGRKILTVLSENLTEGMWIKSAYDTTQPQILEDIKTTGPLFQWIAAEKLDDGYDVDIEVDINNATPAAMAQALQSYQNFLAMVQMYPAVAMSPVLIRETAYRCGYRNEKVIQQMQQAAILSMAAKASMANGGQPLPNSATGGNSNNTAQAQMATPTAPQVENQLANQV